MEEEKESLLLGYPNAINYDCSKEIIKQMEKCICKIKLEGEKQGTGFFCKIPFPTQNNLLPVLITNNHIIDNALLNKPDIKIKIDIKEEIDFKEINLNKRMKYSEEKYDTTIIELKESDNIKNYLELNNIIINGILNKERRYIDLISETIYIIQYPEGKLSVSYGTLKDFYIDKEYIFQHLCCTKHGSSGSPILSLDNKVIGIHKSGKNEYNLGTILDYPLREFVKLNCKKDYINNIMNTTENIEDSTNIMLSKEYNNSLIIQKNESETNLNLISNEENNDLNNIISKDIICPECKENILIDISDFKIKLYECKNNHIFNNILINKYYETQKIKNNIECSICNKNNSNDKDNKDNYVCNTCNINLCSECKSKHDKNHLIINQVDINYVCRKHNESFIKYCTKCLINLCIVCENEHKEHNIFDFKKILINKNILTKKLKELKSVIENYKNKINIMKEILDKTTNMMDFYYKINENYINNYNINKRNYHKLINLNQLKRRTEKLVEDLNNIIKNDKFSDIFEFAFDKFYNTNGEKYFGELRNNLKEGKGILYYDIKDEEGRKKFEGNFKNDKKEGEGIMYWNNGNRFKGQYKNDKREGKGIYYYSKGDIYDGNFVNDVAEGNGIYFWNDGDRYEGNWKNDKREGWGIYHWKNGDKYEGDWKNDKREGKGTKIYKNLGRYSGDWKNEKKDGIGIMHFCNGNIYNGEWKNGLREGNGVMYYNDGKIEKGFWKNDICMEINSFI